MPSLSFSPAMYFQISPLFTSMLMLLSSILFIALYAVGSGYPDPFRYPPGHSLPSASSPLCASLFVIVCPPIPCFCRFRPCVAVNSYARLAFPFLTYSHIRAFASSNPCYFCYGSAKWARFKLLHQFLSPFCAVFIFFIHSGQKSKPFTLVVHSVHILLSQVIIRLLNSSSFACLIIFPLGMSHSNVAFRFQQNWQRSSFGIYSTTLFMLILLSTAPTVTPAVTGLFALLFLFNVQVFEHSCHHSHNDRIPKLLIQL